MAKIGNETRLILKLANERIKASGRLQEELEFRGLPGNYPEQFTWQSALEVGYRTAIKEYRDILSFIVDELENR